MHAMRHHQPGHPVKVCSCMAIVSSGFGQFQDGQLHHVCRYQPGGRGQGRFYVGLISFRVSGLGDFRICPPYSLH